jgi:hypothetical protein
MTSKIFQLNVSDFLKSLVMAATASVTGYLLVAFNSGSFKLDLHQIALYAAIGVLGYLEKQLGTSQTVTSAPAVLPTASVPNPVPAVTVTEKTFGVTTSQETVPPTSTVG